MFYPTSEAFFNRLNGPSSPPRILLHCYTSPACDVQCVQGATLWWRVLIYLLDVPTFPPTCFVCVCVSLHYSLISHKAFQQPPETLPELVAFSCGLHVRLGRGKGETCIRPNIILFFVGLRLKSSVVLCMKCQKILSTAGYNFLQQKGTSSHVLFFPSNTIHNINIMHDREKHHILNAA